MVKTRKQSKPRSKPQSVVTAAQVAGYLVDLQNSEGCSPQLYNIISDFFDAISNEANRQMDRVSRETFPVYLEILTSSQA